jgi:hypothetical protein
MQAAAVQNIQKFSFKGYDQQPPGFSKPGFCLFSPFGLPENYPSGENG